MDVIQLYIWSIATLIKGSDVNIPKSSSGGPVPLDHRTVEIALQAVFGIAGGIALIMVVIGGLKYINSLGNAQNVAKAKDTILYAIIGLVVCILGSAIVGFVTRRVT